MKTKTNHKPEPRLFYYYRRDADNHIHSTVCVAISPDGQHFTRGMAVRSQSDNPCKATGRKWARSRALQAYYTGEAKVSAVAHCDLFYKSNPAPALLPLEKKFVDIVKKQLTATDNGD